MMLRVLFGFGFWIRIRIPLVGVRDVVMGSRRL